jgi:DNA-binding CsgD family transcriptional regulator
MSSVPGDAERSPAEAAEAHSASIEFELAEGRPVGSISFDGSTPEAFEGFDELERRIATIVASQPSLVLVRDDDGPAPGDGLAELTEREREVAVAAAGGATNREIAAALFYSVKSIEAYLTRAYRKLEISGRSELGRLVEAPGSREVEDLEVPERLGADLSGGGTVSAAGGAAERRVGIELLIVRRRPADTGAPSPPG